jgi:hypothetical protein
MRIEDEVRRLAEAASGTRILDTAADVARFHRIPGSPGYDDAVDVILRKLEAAGVRAAVHEYPADGRTSTYGWVSPPAWTVRSGMLFETAPTERKLADFDEVSQTVVVHSPGGTFEGEMIHLGVPAGDSDYDARDLAGKVVLACARASEVVRRAAERGAVGVIVYPDPERAATSHELVSYQSLFPSADAISGLVPAFSVSRRVGDRLVKELGDGPVRLRGEIDAEFHHGSVKVIDATVRGTASGAGTVLFSAHLCHPRGSANDNASGAAVLAELARVLQARPVPADVRFLWMPEFYGSLPWAASRAEELRRVEYVLNLDMVGASPERIGEPLRVFRAANHTPHFVNALVEPLLNLVAAERATSSARGSSRPLHWAFEHPSGGSDHLVFAASPHRLPALMFGHEDPYWHTDFDTPDKLDPTRLKQVAVLAGAIAALADPRGEAADRVGDWLLAYGVREMSRAAGIARQALPEQRPRLLDLALGIEVARAQSMPALSRERCTALVDILRRTRAALGVRPAESSPDRESGAERPVRRLDGPLVYTIGERWSEEEREFFKGRFGTNHRALAEGLLNHCDGSNTLLDIALLLSLDAGALIDSDDVRRGILLLRKAGYVT